jgi:hypothetical protein
LTSSTEASFSKFPISSSESVELQVSSWGARISLESSGEAGIAAELAEDVSIALCGVAICEEKKYVEGSEPHLSVDCGFGDLFQELRGSYF